MRFRTLQVVGLVSAMGVASFGTGTAIAQKRQTLQSQSSPLATEGEQLNLVYRSKAENQQFEERPFEEQSPENEADNQVSQSESTRLTQKVQATLDQVGNIEYVAVPFIDVKTDLEDKFKFNIVLDQSARDDALTEEEPVTVRLRNVRYSDGLRLLLSSFNATYTIKNGILRIISLGNVDDPENHSRLMIDVQPTLDLIERFDGRMNSHQFKETDKSVIPGVILSRIIMSVVQDDAWQENGNGDAALAIAGGVLIARGPDSLLSEVKDFVQDLQAQLEAKTH